MLAAIRFLLLAVHWTGNGLPQLSDLFATFVRKMRAVKGLAAQARFDSNPEKPYGAARGLTHTRIRQELVVVSTLCSGAV